jgi:hypothetical protein
MAITIKKNIENKNLVIICHALGSKLHSKKEKDENPPNRSMNRNTVVLIIFKSLGDLILDCCFHKVVIA